MNRSWKDAEELFHAVVELPPDERARELRQRSGDDEEIVRLVEELVAADRSSEDVLDGDAAELVRRLLDEPAADLLCGRTFGAYRIEEHVASGGMGHVYRATRTTSGIERRVALKVLRPGLASDGLVERFRRERTTLAALEHEHVVSFLDAGALDDGRPYLVMEFVEGVGIDEWARGDVSRREVLGLFLDVLAAVQYAHQKLVVHRDLKPSNILVTPQGKAKLLDFGVASMLDEGSSADGSACFTPEFASPEQLRGETVTTASDVYSLGVVLREALAIDAGTDGDLAAIMAKSLDPEPENRYASADRFAEDLRRHLAFLPVSARAGTWSYRALRFARRHALACVSVLVVVLVLAAGWIGAEVGRRRAVRETTVGWSAHAQARFFAATLEDWVAARAAQGGDASNLAVAHLESALIDLERGTEAEALIQMSLARLHLAAGAKERARPHARRALDLCETARGLGRGDRRRARDLVEQIDLP